MRTKLSPLIPVKQEPADAVLDSTATADGADEELMLIVNRQRAILQAHNRQTDEEVPNHNRHNNYIITNAPVADIDSNNNTRNAVESRYPHHTHQNNHHAAHWPAKSTYDKILTNMGDGNSKSNNLKY